MIYASSSSTNYKSILQHIFNATNFTIFTTLFLGMIVQQIEWDSFTIHFTHLITTLFNNLFITLHPSFSSSIQFMNNTFTTISSQLMKQFMNNTFTTYESYVNTFSQPHRKIYFNKLLIHLHHNKLSDKLVIHSSSHLITSHHNFNSSQLQLITTSTHHILHHNIYFNIHSTIYETILHHILHYNNEWHSLTNI